MENDGVFVYGVLVLLSAATLLGMFMFGVSRFIFCVFRPVVTPPGLLKKLCLDSKILGIDKKFLDSTLTLGIS